MALLVCLSDLHRSVYHYWRFSVYFLLRLRANSFNILSDYLLLMLSLGILVVLEIPENIDLLLIG